MNRMNRMTVRLFFMGILLGSLCRGQTYLGNYTGYTVRGKATTVYADTSSLRFIFYRADIVRVDFLPHPSTVPDSSFIIVQDSSVAIGAIVTETDSSLSLSSPDITIFCKKYPLRVSYYSSAGKLLLAEPEGGGVATYNAQRMAKFSLAPDDHLYGTGERGTSLDKRGQSFQSINTQTYGYTQPLATMNINVPLIVSLKGYAVYFDNTYRGNFDFGVARPDEFYYAVPGGELTYYFMSSDTLTGLLERYTWLTGRQPLPPRWAFGYLQSKYGYQNAAEAASVIQRMRQDNIPCDAIILDLYWYYHMGDLSWNTASWPDPGGMISDFLAQGIKTIVITEPYIVEYSGNFPAAAADGYLARNSSGDPYLLSNWWSCSCNAGLLDITNPAARTWWWNKHPAFMGDSMGGIWTDLGEPETHPLDMVHSLGSTLKVHNIYNFLWAQTLFNGFRDIYPGRRLFNLTRSGYAGIQRYGVITWSGDVGKSFGGLAVQLPILLGMGLSGIAYHNSDIGGFCCGTTTPELYSRWMEFGAFCPVTRAHGSGQGTEPWAFGDTTEQISRKFIRLRYSLLPYIYTMAYENYRSGLPLVRPLFFEDPSDPILWNESSSYLWGSAMLVSPVVQSGQRSKTVYLPKGTWIEYWTDERFSGNQNVTVRAPLDRMPVFVKSGSIIPTQPVGNYTDERVMDTLILQCYPDSLVQGAFTLYEDDGRTLEYQSGRYARTLFSLSLSPVHGTGDTSGTLEITVGKADGIFSGKLPNRVYLCDVHSIMAKPAAVYVNGQGLAESFSLDLLRQSARGFFYDDSLRQVFIQFTGRTDSVYSIVAQLPLTSTLVQGEDLPGNFRLIQNYPNPFNPSTKIGYEIRTVSFVSLKIYDILGREIATLQNNIQQPGKYSVYWDAGVYGGGVYFYRLTATTLSRSPMVYSTARKMILVK